MKLLEQIRTINPRTPGEWPWPVKLTVMVGMFLAVVSGGAVLDWQGQWETLGNARQEEDKLKDTFLVKKRQAINLDIIKKQLTETQQSFGALLKQLPSKSEMDALLTDINQAGLGRGLQFELFKPGKEVVTGVFAVQPITIRVTGSYDDLGWFSSDVSQLPRIVTLNDVSIVPVGSKSTTADVQLSMNATAKTYRYLDEAELAARNAKGSKKAGKSGGKK